MSKNITYEINQKNAKEGFKVYQDILANETANPLDNNLEFLLGLLKDNKNTEYGKRFHFKNIHNISSYQKNVPIVNYEDIEPYIERMKKGQKNILTAYPFNHMNETSGTLGKCKYVPMTDRQTSVYLRYNNLAINGCIAKCVDKKWMKGRTMLTTEDEPCIHLPSGITLGGAAAKQIEYLKSNVDSLNLFNAIYTTPIEATEVQNGADRFYIQTRFALMDKGMTGIITDFFSQIVYIFGYIAKNYRILIDDITHGTINPSIAMPDEVKKSLMKRITPMPERGRELSKIFKNGSNFVFAKKVWPNLSYIFGAGTANFAAYDKILSKCYIGKDVDRIYSGVVASEGLWSFPIFKNNPNTLLATKSVFFEFLPVEAGDDFTKIVTIDKVKVGKTYELIITNACGFYRYRMRDAVTIKGYYKNTPLIEFAYRTNNTISINNEKTTEAALKHAVNKTAKQLKFEYFDFCVCPSYRGIPNYIFLIEPIGDISRISIKKLNNCIAKNLYKVSPTYQYHVEVSKYLSPPSVSFLKKGTFDIYRSHIVKFKKSSQLKPPKILLKENIIKFFLDNCQKNKNN